MARPLYFTTNAIKPFRCSLCQVRSPFAPLIPKSLSLPLSLCVSFPLKGCHFWRYFDLLKMIHLEWISVWVGMFPKRSFHIVFDFLGHWRITYKCICEKCQTFLLTQYMNLHALHTLLLQNILVKKKLQ